MSSLKTAYKQGSRSKYHRAERDMNKLKLNFACWNYDRTRALKDGDVTAEGIALNYLNLPPEDIFFRMLKHGEFEASEMSLSSYTLSLSESEPRFIAIPAFVSRVFRHSCIYINSNSGILSANDLVGKKIGCPEYQMTATVWIRGIMADYYDVPVDSVDYFTGGQEHAGRKEKLKLALPANIRVHPIDDHKTLSQMLASGEIDALYTARKPSTYGDGKGAVRRLFADFRSEEQDYFAKSKVFPIMHTVVIRRDVYQQNRWVAQSLMNALRASKRMAAEELHEDAALKVMVPWLPSQIRVLEQTAGGDYWPYGISENRHTLGVFLRYFHEQGLSSRMLSVEDLFARETFEDAKI